MKTFTTESKVIKGKLTSRVALTMQKRFVERFTQAFILELYPECPNRENDRVSLYLDPRMRKWAVNFRKSHLKKRLVTAVKQKLKQLYTRTVELEVEQSQSVDVPDTESDTDEDSGDDIGKVDVSHVETEKSVPKLVNELFTMLETHEVSSKNSFKCLKQREGEKK